MRVDDLIEVDLKNGVHLWWRVSGIYLGATHHESVVHLVPVDQKPNTQGSPTLVPVQLLDLSIATGAATLHSPSDRTPREKQLLEMLLEANDVLRSCWSIIERPENTNWEGLKNRVECELKNQHIALSPIRIEKIHAANRQAQPVYAAAAWRDTQ